MEKVAVQRYETINQAKFQEANFMVMKRALSTLCALTLLYANNCIAGESECRANEKNGETCAVLHGRLLLYFNSSFELWPVGSNRIIWIDHTNLPVDLFNELVDRDVAFADFTVCFYDHDVPGFRRSGCVANATRLVVISEEAFEKLQKGN